MSFLNVFQPAVWSFWVLGVGYILNLDKDTTNQATQKTTKQSTSSAKTATSSAIKDKTSEWRTFKDTALGFEIKYSDGWYVTPAEGWTEDTQNTGGATTNLYNYDPDAVEPGHLRIGEYKVTISKSTKSKTKSLKEFTSERRVDCCPPQFYGDLEKTKIGVYEAYKDTAFLGTKEDPGKDTVHINIEINSETVLSFTARNGAKEYASIFDLMMSTFKLLN